MPRRRRVVSLEKGAGLFLRVGVRRILRPACLCKTHSCCANSGTQNRDYFSAARHFAHLALVAALIRARPAAEMRRLGAIETTFRCPFTLAQRALCAVAILARAAALIVRRSRVTPVLFNPLSALIAV